jgi:hypothetical protein
MMEMGGALVVAMVLMMLVMMGGMAFGALRAVGRRRRGKSDER